MGSVYSIYRLVVSSISLNLTDFVFCASSSNMKLVELASSCCRSTAWMISENATIVGPDYLLTSAMCAMVMTAVSYHHTISLLGPTYGTAWLIFRRCIRFSTSFLGYSVTWSSAWWNRYSVKIYYFGQHGIQMLFRQIWVWHGSSDQLFSSTALLGFSDLQHEMWRQMTHIC